MKKIIFSLFLILTASCSGLTPNSEIVLPESFPTFQVNVSKPSKMERGHILFALRQKPVSYIIKVNSGGEIVSLLEVPYRVGDLREVNGEYLFIGGEDSIIILDQEGNEMSKFAASRFTPAKEGYIPVDASEFHHEVIKMKNGNLVSLSREVREFEEYPSSETDPMAPLMPAVVSGDVIVEFDENGKVINELSLLDIIDPYRIGYGSLKPFGDIEGLDWTHGNAVIYDESDDTFITSLRHQDATIKLSRSTGEIKWILGTHDNWGPEFQEYLLTPVGADFKWPYHQHAPQITPHGTLMLYDNGNWRGSPFHSEKGPDATYSRAVEYKINEQTMEIEQVWEFDANGEIYTPFIGDADFLKNTGNTLVTFGGITKEGFDSAFARLIEVTRDGEVVFDLEIRKSHPEQQGWTVYRSEKIPFDF